MLQARGTTEKRSRLVWLVCVLPALFFLWRWTATFSTGDFSAFYCSGRALYLHQDPYLRTSLQACEQHLLTLSIAKIPNQAVNIIPSPFPAYAIAFFGLFSFAGPLAAAILWTALLLLASGYFIAGLRQLTNLPAAALLAIFYVPVIAGPVASGQITPLIFAAFLFMVIRAQQGDARLAACGAIFTMLEPHVGLAVCAALAIAVPRTRLYLLCGCAALAAVSLALMPVAQLHEYFSAELPQHALAEVHRSAQFSLTHWLVTFGLNEHFAATLGSAQYVLMLIAGSILAWRLKMRDHALPLVLVCVPLCAMFGGAYIHLQQLSFSAIAAVFLYTRCRNDAERLPLFFVLLALALPLEAVSSGMSCYLYAYLAAVLAVTLDKSTRTIAFAALAAFDAAFVTQMLMSRRINLATQHGLVVDDPRLLALQKQTNNLEVYCRAYTDLYLSTQGPWSLVLQAPTVAAYAAVIAFIGKLALAKNYATPSRSPEGE